MVRFVVASLIALTSPFFASPASEAPPVLTLTVQVSEIAGGGVTETIDLYLLDGTIIRKPLTAVGAVVFEVPETGDYLVGRAAKFNGATLSATCPDVPVTVSGPTTVRC